MTLDRLPNSESSAWDACFEEVLRYLSSTGDCWWTARRIGGVLPYGEGNIQRTLELAWRGGRLRRKRGLRGEYEYQTRPPDQA
jgi:hypothetical protein